MAEKEKDIITRIRSVKARMETFKLEGEKAERNKQERVRGVYVAQHFKEKDAQHGACRESYYVALPIFLQFYKERDAARNQV